MFIPLKKKTLRAGEWRENQSSTRKCFKDKVKKRYIEEQENQTERKNITHFW